MKVCVLQPYYSLKEEDTQSCFDGILSLLAQCDDSLDLIVLPEYSDVPAAQPDKAHFDASVRRYNQNILNACMETAKRCSALVFVNAASEGKNGYRNTTYAINREGEIIGQYFKAHPAPSEIKTAAQGGNGLDTRYADSPAPPFILEAEGLRFAFMTCYDFYFYEAFARLALEQPDIIIGCSHQRTDTHAALEILHRFLCYNTNAYLVRSAVSLGEDSHLCGCSTVVAPDGSVLVDMKSQTGLGICEIDPHKKYLKPAGFLGKEKPHYAYLEEGRRPWLYRNAGSAIIQNDRDLPYPRICAHRGFSAAMPENSMPSFGAAVALGAEEIEFDLWPTADGEIVSCHDDTLERVSTGSGKIYEQTLCELKKLDFGVRFSPEFRGLSIPLFEDILKKFAGQVIMNIHIKTLPYSNRYPDDLVRKIISLLRRYDCEKHAYLMISPNEIIRQFQSAAPDIAICVGHIDEAPWSIVDRAIQLNAQKVQLFKPYLNQEMIRKAHAHGIRCNVFFADEENEARQYLEMGVDTVLSNHCLKIKPVVDAYRPAVFDRSADPHP